MYAKLIYREGQAGSNAALSVSKMGKVETMTKQNNAYKAVQRIMRFLFAMMAGAFISAFSFGAFTAQAAETTVESAAAVNEEQAPIGESASDDGGGAMILLMGGMLIIILAVVLSVVGTFVSSAAIADEL